jgi:hypothetical protein
VVRLKAVVLGFGGTREKLVISALEEATGIQGSYLGPPATKTFSMKTTVFIRIATTTDLLLRRGAFAHRLH